MRQAVLHAPDGTYPGDPAARIRSAALYNLAKIQTDRGDTAGAIVTIAMPRKSARRAPSAASSRSSIAMPRPRSIRSRRRASRVRSNRSPDCWTPALDTELVLGAHALSYP